MLAQNLSQMISNLLILIQLGDCKCNPLLLVISWAKSNWIKELLERIAGDVSDDGNEVMKNTDDDRCKVKVWRCLSKVLESGVKHMEKPGGMWR